MFQINVNNGNKSIILTVSIMLSTSSILYKVKINKRFVSQIQINEKKHLRK